MNPTEHLSRQERIRRIAELLAKGIALMHMRDAGTPVTPNISRRAKHAGRRLSHDDLIPIEGLDAEGQSIVDYLRCVGNASPSNIREQLHLSRTSVWRRLKELETLGVIAKSGRTRSARYGLVAPAPCETNETKSAGESGL